jgi:hypothetical protein
MCSVAINFSSDSESKYAATTDRGLASSNSFPRYPHIGGGGGGALRSSDECRSGGGEIVIVFQALPGTLFLRKKTIDL